MINFISRELINILKFVFYIIKNLKRFTSVIEDRYLRNGDSYVRGVSQAYSQLVDAYYLKETPHLSDQPFSSYRL